MTKKNQRKARETITVQPANDVREILRRKARRRANPSPLLTNRTALLNETVRRRYAPGLEEVRA